MLLARYGLAAFLSLTSLAAVTPSHADQDMLRLVKTPGFSALPLMVMEHEKILENSLAEAGVPDTKVEWTRISGGALVNDALLSGNLDIGTGGIGPLATIAGRTAGTAQEVKGVAAVVSQPIYLNCNDKSIKSLADLKENHRIAVPAVKVSIQAVLLQIEAAKEFGKDKANAIDHLTVSIPSNDAIATLVSGAGSLTCHMAAEPHYTMEMQSDNIHTVVDSYEILGSPHNISVAYTTRKFRDNNPKLYGAFLDALAKAQKFIDDNPRRAAEIYLTEAPGKLSVDEVEELIQNEKNIYSSVPYGTEKVANFMHESGALDKGVSSWKDIYFEDIHELDGN